MKAKLTFNLPEELHEYQQTVFASEMQLSLWEFDQWLRSEQKYNNRESIDVQELRDKLRDIMAQNSLNFDMPLFQ